MLCACLSSARLLHLASWISSKVALIKTMTKITMKIFLQKQERVVEQHFEGSARDLLKELGVNPEEVLIVKDGTLITLDDSIDDAKKIDLLSVISGG